MPRVYGEGPFDPDKDRSELKGARGIEPPPGFLDRADGFAARGAPSTIAPDKQFSSAGPGSRAKGRVHSVRGKDGVHSSARLHSHQTRVAVLALRQVKPKNGYIAGLLSEDDLQVDTKTDIVNISISQIGKIYDFEVNQCFYIFPRSCRNGPRCKAGRLRLASASARAEPPRQSRLQGQSRIRLA